jgi:hypothetical protein
VLLASCAEQTAPRLHAGEIRHSTLQGRCERAQAVPIRRDRLHEKMSLMLLLSLNDQCDWD